MNTWFSEKAGGALICSVCQFHTHHGQLQATDRSHWTWDCKGLPTICSCEALRAGSGTPLLSQWEVKYCFQMMHDSNECERVEIKIKRCGFKPYSATDCVTLRKPFKLSISLLSTEKWGQKQFSCRVLRSSRVAWNDSTEDKENKVKWLIKDCFWRGGE